jgi:6-phosphogluconolactonase
MPLKTIVCDDNAALISKSLSVVVSLIENEKQRKQPTASSDVASRVSLALSGGSTPKALYAAIKAHHLPLAASAVQYYFGDVRMVPDSSTDSNFLMAFEQLLHAIPTEHVTKIATVDISAADSAAAFEAALTSQLPLTANGCPQFDIVLLGVGPDGHTASLFPGTPASNETERFAVPCMPNEGITPYVERVTITRRVIQAARHVVVMAAGKDKQWVLEGILATEGDIASDATSRVPVARLLRECSGEVHLIVNRDMVKDALLASL